MMSIQYTIRAVPPNVDKALRQQAKATGKSLNEVVVAVLEKGTGVTANASFDDLDWFIGGKSLPGTFDEDITWLDSLPQDME